MPLLEKQMIFAQAVASLLLKVDELGYQVTLGEAYRTPEQAALNAKTGKGIANSLHCLRLAIDINLFKDGAYLTDSKDYEPLGVWWESLSEDGLIFAWGGRFSKPDGNHFSISHNSVR